MAFRLLTKQNSYIHGHSDTFAPAEAATDFTEPLGLKIRTTNHEDHERKPFPTYYNHFSTCSSF